MSATTTQPTKPSRAEIFRIANFTAVILLLIQFALGMGYALFGPEVSSDHPAGLFSDGALALHFILGIIIVLGAIDLVIRGIKSGTMVGRATTIIGLIAVIIAFGNGIGFTRDGSNGESMGMAMTWAIAMLCYAINLYVARPPDSRMR